MSLAFVVTLSVYVEWDKNDRVNVCRYGHDGAFDLLLVDEPRVLSKFEPIAVGCIVKKGRFLFVSV